MGLDNGTGHGHRSKKETIISWEKGCCWGGGQRHAVQVGVVGMTAFCILHIEGEGIGVPWKPETFVEGRVMRRTNASQCKGWWMPSVFVDLGCVVVASKWWEKEARSKRVAEWNGVRGVEKYAALIHEEKIEIGQRKVEFEVTLEDGPVTWGRVESIDKLVEGEGAKDGWWVSKQGVATVAGNDNSTMWSAKGEDCCIDILKGKLLVHDWGNRCGGLCGWQHRLPGSKGQNTE